MAFSAVNRRTGKTYYLHARNITLRNTGGKGLTIYYFALKPGENAIDAIPEGYEVYEHKHTGTLFLRKVKTGQNQIPP